MSRKNAANESGRPSLRPSLPPIRTSGGGFDGLSRVLEFPVASGGL